MSASSISHKILHFTLTKIFIGLIVCAGLVGFAQMGLAELLETTSLSTDYQSLIAGVFGAGLTISAYIYLFKIYEKRKIAEFSTSRMGNWLIKGLLLGAILQSLTILFIYIKGGYTVLAINPINYIILPFTISFTSAIIEEVVLRGIVFRILEEKLGSYIALGISALLFGLMHIGNPGSTWIASIGLAIQAGLLLGAAYIYSRNLWFPIAIHFAWNFTQSAIFGATVSGYSLERTLISSEISGADWFTGGLFGPEGSIQATIFCLIATIILIYRSHKEGKIIKPFKRLPPF